MDLVRDNPGPLAELWNLDKGCWVVALWRDTPDTDNAEIQSSSLARDSSKPRQQNSLTDSKGEVFLATSAHLESIVFKGFIFFLLFLLTKTI
jgi:hypothetical protein